MKNKSDLAKEGKKFITELKERYGITVKVIRCDNSDKNKTYERELAGGNIMFEYTASLTPQQNGVVERRFAKLYNRIRAIMHSAGIDKSTKQKIWTECAHIATLMDNLLFYDNGKNVNDRLKNNQPKFTKNMRKFGEIGIALNHSLKNIRSKVDDKGIACIFVGYSLKHGEGVCRMYNLKTNRIFISRGIMWLNQTYGQYKNKRIKLKQHPLLQKQME